MADYLNVVGAILGAGLGIYLAFRLGVFRRSNEEPDSDPREQSRPTGYVSTQQPSAAPILGALGATLLGVGLAIASLGGFSLALVIAGIALLVAAVLTAVRRRSNTPR